MSKSASFGNNNNNEPQYFDYHKPNEVEVKTAAADSSNDRVQQLHKYYKSFNQTSTQQPFKQNKQQNVDDSNNTLIEKLDNMRFF